MITGLSIRPFHVGPSIFYTARWKKIPYYPSAMHYLRFVTLRFLFCHSYTDRFLHSRLTYFILIYFFFFSTTRPTLTCCKVGCQPCTLRSFDRAWWVFFFFNNLLPPFFPYLYDDLQFQTRVSEGSMEFRCFYLLFSEQHLLVLFLHKARGWSYLISCELRTKKVS